MIFNAIPLSAGWSERSLEILSSRPMAERLQGRLQLPPGPHTVHQPCPPYLAKPSISVLGHHLKRKRNRHERAAEGNRRKRRFAGPDDRPCDPRPRRGARAGACL